MNTTSEFALSGEELEHWERAGFVGPFSAWTPIEIDWFLPKIQAAYQRPSAVFGFNTNRDRHLDSQAICTVGTNPAIVERCRELYGPNLLLWRTNLFHKPPGGNPVGAHQGLGFPGIVNSIPSITPPVNISAWVALTDCTIESGCVQLFPGTHKKTYEKMHRTLGSFGRGIEFLGLEDIDPVYMEMRRGQFFLFNEAVIHRSDVNHSKVNRTGIVFRFTPTSTKVYDENPIDCRGMPLKRWHTILVCGENTYSHNRLGEAPDHDDYSSGPIRKLIGAFRERYYRRFHGMQG
ncbi:MAG: phytanoyl-CoA dioxygenase family protein [Planctomycetota bacterium]|jgi:hypothetical protein